MNKKLGMVLLISVIIMTSFDYYNSYKLDELTNITAYEIIKDNVFLVAVVAGILVLIKMIISLAKRFFIQEK